MTWRKLAVCAGTKFKGSSLRNLNDCCLAPAHFCVIKMETSIMQITKDAETRTPRGMSRSGLVLFSYGFRPFFLAAALWAIESGWPPSSTVLSIALLARSTTTSLPDGLALLSDVLTAA